MNLPESMDEEAVASALCFASYPQDGRENGYSGYCASRKSAWRRVARVCLALVEAERAKEREACRSHTEAKVREAVARCWQRDPATADEAQYATDEIVNRVMGRG